MNHLKLLLAVNCRITKYLSIWSEFVSDLTAAKMECKSQWKVERNLWIVPAAEMRQIEVAKNGVKTFWQMTWKFAFRFWTRLRGDITSYLGLSRCVTNGEVAKTLWRNPNMEHVISISCVCDASRRIDNASFRSITRCQVVYKVVEQPSSANRWQLQFAQKAKWCERVFVLSVCVFFYPIYVFTFSQPFWQSEWIRNGGKNYATRGRAEQTSVEWAGWRGEWRREENAVKRKWN